MTNNQAMFLGSCILIGSGFVGVGLSRSVGDDTLVFPILGGVILAIVALAKMGAEAKR